MKKILKTFIFLAIMMGLFLVPKVEATEIDFEQKVKDMKDYLAPNSIYVYMKQGNKEWETTLTDGDKNSNDNLSMLYTGISFLKDKEIDLFIITPHTYGNKCDIYDMDIDLNIEKSIDSNNIEKKRVEQVGKVKEKYGAEGYVAFLYTVKVTDNARFGESITIKCKGTIMSDVDYIYFTLPIFIHIEDIASNYYTDSTVSNGIDVEKIITDFDLKNKFKNNVEGKYKNNTWVYMKQGNVTWDYNFCEATTGNNKFNKVSSYGIDNGYRANGKVFKTGEYIDIVTITHCDKSFGTVSPGAVKIGSLQSAMTGVIDEEILLLKRIDYYNHFLVGHYRIKLNKNSGGNANCVLIPMSMQNVKIELMSVFMLGVYVNNKYDDEYYNKTHQINLEETIETYNLREIFKNATESNGSANSVWMLFKQGDKVLDVHFNKALTGEKDFNSMGTENMITKGYNFPIKKGFEADKEIEILLVTHQNDFNYETEAKILNTDQSEKTMGSNITTYVKLFSYIDSDNKFSAHHFKIKLKEDNTKSTSKIFFQVYNQTMDVAFRMPVTIFLHDKTKKEINIWEEYWDNYSKLSDFGFDRSGYTETLYVDNYGSYQRKHGNAWQQNKLTNNIYMIIQQGTKKYTEIISGVPKQFIYWGAYEIQTSINGANPTKVLKNQPMAIEMMNISKNIPITFNMNEKIEIMFIFRPEDFSEWGYETDQNIVSSIGWKGKTGYTTNNPEIQEYRSDTDVGFVWYEVKVDSEKNDMKVDLISIIANDQLNAAIFADNVNPARSSTTWTVDIQLMAKDLIKPIIKEGQDKIKDDNDVMVWLVQDDKEYSLKINGDEWGEFSNEISEINSTKYVSGNFDLSRPIEFYSMRKEVSTIKGVSFVKNISTKEYEVSISTKKDDGYILTIGTIEFKNNKIKEEGNELFLNIETTDSEHKNHYCKFALNHKLREEEIKEIYEKEELDKIFNKTGIKYNEVSEDANKNLGEGELKLIVGNNVLNETATLKGLTSVDLPKDNRVRVWPDNTIGVFLYYKDKELVTGKFKEIIIIEEGTGNKLATITKDNPKADTEKVKASIEKEEFVKNVGSSMDAVKSIMTFDFSKSGTYTIKVIMETKKGSTTTLTTINIKLVISETVNSSEELEGILGSGKNWLDTGLSGANKTLDTNKLMDLSNQLYNMFIIIAIAAAIIVGGILGIRYMTAGIDQKVQVKETLIPYAISCIVVFGAAGIWRLIVLLVQQI